MKEAMNIWGIREFEGDGISCPVVPANVPWHKKMVLTFFRFGICPLCITSSVAYSISTFFKHRFRSGTNKNTESAKNGAELPLVSLSRK